MKQTIKKLLNGDFQISYENENGNVEVIDQREVNETLANGENLAMVQQMNELFKMVEEIVPPRESTTRPK